MGPSFHYPVSCNPKSEQRTRHGVVEVDAVPVYTQNAFGSLANSSHVSNTPEPLRLSTPTQ